MRRTTLGRPRWDRRTRCCRRTRWTVVPTAAGSIAVRRSDRDADIGAGASLCRCSSNPAAALGVPDGGAAGAGWMWYSCRLVMPKEQVFQRGRLADQTAHACVTKQLDHLADAVAVDGGVQRVAIDGDV